MTDIPDEAVEAVEDRFDFSHVPDEREFIRSVLTAAAPIIRAQAFADGHREGFRTALADFQSGAFISGPVFDATDAIRADERRRVLDLLPLPGEDARSGMLHARALIAARIAERSGE